MNRARNAIAVLSTGFALVAACTSASAEWRWVEEDSDTSTYAYDEPLESGYYQQQPRSYEEQRYTEERYVAPVVTSREIFRDGPCDVTRTYLSDGTTQDERICDEVRLVLPHEFLIDRIGRHFDRLRARQHQY